MMIFFFKSERRIEQRRRFSANATIAVCILLIAVVLYSTEFSAFTQMFNKLFSLLDDYENGTNISGRGGDALMMNLVMQHNFVFGVGAFNAVTIFGSWKSATMKSSVTNMYITFFCELGILGMTLFIFVSLLFARNFIKRLRAVRNSPYYSNIFSYCVVIPVMLAWIRIFFFHQIWIVLSLAYLNKIPPVIHGKGN